MKVGTMDNQQVEDYLVKFGISFGTKFGNITEKQRSLRLVRVLRWLNEILVQHSNGNTVTGFPALAGDTEVLQ